jgi:alpha-tubulin suppressor-like RCC1 family protein
MGNVNYDVYRRIYSNHPNLHIAYEGLQYAAEPVLSFTEPSLLSTPAGYTGNVVSGTDAMLTEISVVMSRCKTYTKFVLSGYSQGAWVVHRVVNKLSSTQRKQVAGVLLFGDPLYRAFMPWNRTNYALNIKNGAAFSNNVDAANSAVPKDMQARTASYCNVLDPVCQFPYVTWSDHMIYVTNGNAVAGADFIKDNLPTTVSWTKLSSVNAPDGKVGSRYSWTLSATGAVGTVIWSYSGTLPPGLKFAGGKLTGTPTQAGRFTFNVKATDSIGRWDARDYTVTIGGPLGILTGFLPCGTVNEPYAAKFDATGGVAPYSWAVASGSLPAGLALNAATGDITGVPTAVGSSTFIAKVTDRLGATSSKSLSATIASSCLQGGDVAAWGFNNTGRLGDGTTNMALSPVATLNLSDVKSVAAGQNHSVAVDYSGAVWTWGFNNYGQLGDGSTTMTTAPAKINGVSNIVEVAAGNSFTVARRADGTVWTWGRNDYGQLGIGTTTASLVPVQVPGLSNVTDIAADEGESVLVVLSDGTVRAWGYNYFGQLGNGTTDNSNVPVAVPGLSNVTSVAISGNNGLALLANGTAMAWGPNSNGQLGDGTTVTSFTPVAVQLTGINSIALQSGASMALKTDQTVWAWGSNTYGQLGNDSTTNSALPVQVQGLPNITGIDGGQVSGLALKADGTVWTWGYNEVGQLGDGTTNSSPVAVQVSNLTNVIAVSMGTAHSLAVHK